MNNKLTISELIFESCFYNKETNDFLTEIINDIEIINYEGSKINLADNQCIKALKEKVSIDKTNSIAIYFGKNGSDIDVKNLYICEKVYYDNEETDELDLRDIELDFDFVYILTSVEYTKSCYIKYSSDYSVYEELLKDKIEIINSSGGNLEELNYLINRFAGAKHVLNAFNQEM